MNTEERLSQLLHEDADTYMHSEALGRIHDKARARHRARTIRNAAVPLAMLAIAAVAVPLALRQSDSKKLPVTSVSPPAEVSTTEPPTTAAPPTTIVSAAPTHITEAMFLRIDQLPAGPYWGGQWAQATPIVDPRQGDPHVSNGGYFCERARAIDAKASDVRGRTYFSANDNPDGRQFDEHIELSASDQDAAHTLTTVQTWLTNCQPRDGVIGSKLTLVRSLPSFHDGAALYRNTPSPSGEQLPIAIGVGRVGRVVVVISVSTQGPQSVVSVDPVWATLRSAMDQVAAASAATPPTAAPTVLKSYSPWTAAGTLAPGTKVFGRITGESCFVGSTPWGSIGDPGNQNAWRCNTARGIEDPCFAPPNGTNVYQVVCAGDPSSPVDLVTLSQPLADSSRHQPPPDGTWPWILQLSNGDQCSVIQGTAPSFGQAELYYGCAHGNATQPNTSTKSWTVSYLPQGGKTLATVRVDTAWQ